MEISLKITSIKTGLVVDRVIQKSEDIELKPPRFNFLEENALIVDGPEARQRSSFITKIHVKKISLSEALLIKNGKC